MNVYDPSRTHYTTEDHETWSKLCRRQHDLVKDVAVRDFFPGLQRIGLDYTRIPDLAEMNERLEGLCGWTLVSAENEYLADDVWFEHLRHRRFPVTQYIRRPSELDFTPIPDLFHEYFGHLALVSDPRVAAQAEEFGHLYSAVPAEHRIRVANFWWFSWEFGLLNEVGRSQVFGAGLLSSPGELRYALDPTTPKIPFAFETFMSMRRLPHQYHDGYFVFDSYEQIDDTLRRLRERYAAS